MRRGRRARSLLRLTPAEGSAGVDAYTRGDSPAGMLDLPAVGLQKLSKLRVCARVQYAEARRKLRPKSKNLQGKEAALTHTNGHTGRASTVL